MLAFSVLSNNNGLKPKLMKSIKKYEIKNPAKNDYKEKSIERKNNNNNKSIERKINNKNIKSNEMKINNNNNIKYHPTKKIINYNYFTGEKTTYYLGKYTNNVQNYIKLADKISNDLIMQKKNNFKNDKIEEKNKENKLSINNMANINNKKNKSEEIQNNINPSVKNNKLKIENNLLNNGKLDLKKEENNPLNNKKLDLKKEENDLKNLYKKCKNCSQQIRLKNEEIEKFKKIQQDLTPQNVEYVNLAGLNCTLEEKINRAELEKNSLRKSLIENKNLLKEKLNVLNNIKGQSELKKFEIWINAAKVLVETENLRENFEKLLSYFAENKTNSLKNNSIENENLLNEKFNFLKVAKDLSKKIKENKTKIEENETKIEENLNNLKKIPETYKGKALKDYIKNLGQIINPKLNKYGFKELNMNINEKESKSKNIEKKPSIPSKNFSSVADRLRELGVTKVKDMTFFKKRFSKNK